MDHKAMVQQMSFSELDVRFGRFLERLAGGPSPDLFGAAVLASHFRSLGHSCIDLTAAAGKTYCCGNDMMFRSPPLHDWLATLSTIPVVGKPGDYCPLVLEGSRLYLCRYRTYEETLAASLIRRASSNAEGIDESLLRDGLSRLTPGRGKNGISWTKVAAATAVCKHLSIISGGPGTGKTTTVAAILALLLEQSKGKTLRIALAAPTGKAATRLLQSLREAKQTLPTPEEVKAALPDRSSTLHRLLGSLPRRPQPRYHADRPLPLDVLVIDEASMVDLALFAKLLQALPLRARLILLGDRDQLASVEAGAVLGDICGTGSSHGYSEAFRERYRRLTGETLPAAGESQALTDSVTTLRENFRFDKESGISALSGAVRGGDVSEALALLRKDKRTDLCRHDLPRPDRLSAALETHILPEFLTGLAETDPASALAAFNRIRILCALREGPYGAVAVNGLIEQLLRKKRLIRRDSPWYAGRPVMIVRNDYTLRLFNGDVGIALPDPEAHGELRVFFPTDESAFRSLPTLHLPDHETVFAMTVHKSQGSEFDAIHLILPDRDAPVLARELLYTGITRARKSIAFWGPDEVIRQSITRRTERISGLREALWGNDSLKTG